MSTSTVVRDINTFMNDVTIKLAGAYESTQEKHSQARVLLFAAFSSAGINCENVSQFKPALFQLSLALYPKTLVAKLLDKNIKGDTQIKLGKTSRDKRAWLQGARTRSDKWIAAFIISLKIVVSSETTGTAGGGAPARSARQITFNAKEDESLCNIAMKAAYVVKTRLQAKACTDMYLSRALDTFIDALKAQYPEAKKLFNMLEANEVKMDKKSIAKVTAKV